MLAPTCHSVTGCFPVAGCPARRVPLYELPPGRDPPVTPAELSYTNQVIAGRLEYHQQLQPQYVLITAVVLVCVNVISCKPKPRPLTDLTRLQFFELGWKQVIF